MSLPGASSIVTQLRGGPAERAAAYAELEMLAEGPALLGPRSEVRARDAATYVATILDSVLTAPAEKVGTAEWTRAAAAATGLSRLNPSAIGGMQLSRYEAVWTAAGSAFDVALSKDPDQLTREDVLCIGSEQGITTVIYAKGYDEAATTVGVDFQTVVELCPGMMWVSDTRYMSKTLATRATPGLDEAFNKRLAHIALGLLMDPPQSTPAADKLNVFAGLWIVLAWAISGKPAIIASVVNAGALEFCMETLRKMSPVDWLNPLTPSGLLADRCFSLMYVFSTVSELPGFKSMLSAVVDSGMVSMIIQFLKVYEIRGDFGIDKTITCGICCCTLPPVRYVMRCIGAVNLTGGL
jgi:hypothetical protein